MALRRLLTCNNCLSRALAELAWKMSEWVFDDLWFLTTFPAACMWALWYVWMHREMLLHAVAHFALWFLHTLTNADVFYIGYLFPVVVVVRALQNRGRDKGGEATANE